MIGPLVYLVTSCDYTISNNDLALDMKSALSIPFCGGIKNHVHYHLSILQEILLTYLFMGILDLSDFFLKKPYGLRVHKNSHKLKCSKYSHYTFTI